MFLEFTNPKNGSSYRLLLLPHTKHKDLDRWMVNTQTYYLRTKLTDSDFTNVFNAKLHMHGKRIYDVNVFPTQNVVNWIDKVVFEEVNIFGRIMTEASSSVAIQIIVNIKDDEMIKSEPSTNLVDENLCQQSLPPLQWRLTKQHLMVNNIDTSNEDQPPPEYQMIEPQVLAYDDNLAPIRNIEALHSANKQSNNELERIRLLTRMVQPYCEMPYFIHSLKFIEIFQAGLIPLSRRNISNIYNHELLVLTLKMIRLSLTKPCNEMSLLTVRNHVLESAEQIIFKEIPTIEACISSIQTTDSNVLAQAAMEIFFLLHPKDERFEITSTQHRTCSISVSCPFGFTFTLIERGIINPKGPTFEQLFKILGEDMYSYFYYETNELAPVEQEHSEY